MKEHNFRVAAVQGELDLTNGKLLLFSSKTLTIQHHDATLFALMMCLERKE